MKRPAKVPIKKCCGEGSTILLTLELNPALPEENISFFDLSTTLNPLGVASINRLSSICKISVLKLSCPFSQLNVGSIFGCGFPFLRNVIFEIAVGPLPEVLPAVIFALKALSICSRFPFGRPTYK